MSNTSTGKIREKFTSKQTLIFVLCLIAYSCAYLNRLHISIAIPSMRDIGINNDEAGIITMSFFWTYAIGQLISGWLGDRIPPKYMIGVGLGMSSVCCFILSFMSTGVERSFSVNALGTYYEGYFK